MNFIENQLLNGIKMSEKFVKNLVNVNGHFVNNKSVVGVSFTFRTRKYFGPGCFKKYFSSGGWKNILASIVWTVDHAVHNSK